MVDSTMKFCTGKQNQVFILVYVLEVFHLKLNNTSPAVLDSKVTFTAELVTSNGTHVDSTLYEYEWKDNARFIDPPNRTTNHTISQFHKVFQSFHGIDYHKGDFNMEVTVYKKPKEKFEERAQVAKGKMSFILTGMIKLNDYWT